MFFAFIFHLLIIPDMGHLKKRCLSRNNASEGV
jgi:hypothetical protein